MANDDNLPPVSYPKWRGWVFERLGWLYCAFTGNLDKWAYLVAQARHETGYYTSSLSRNHCNFFGFMYPTKFASGSVNAADGSMAVFPSMLASWRSRIAWDERKGITRYVDGNDYMDQVIAAGYAADPDYKAKWKGAYDALKPWSRWMSMTFDNSPTPWYRRMFGYVLLFLFILLVLYWIWLFISYRTRIAWRRSYTRGAGLK